MSKLCWRPIAGGELNPKELYMPGKRRKPCDLVIFGVDLFDLTAEQIDVILAVVCSTGHTRFFYETRNDKARQSYFRDLRRRGRRAAAEYEAKMRAHFQKYKHGFLEGYSLPAPPTPECRAIYDSAAQWESRAEFPNGRKGWRRSDSKPSFSLGEYHWRDWPLSNLIDENSSVAK